MAGKLNQSCLHSPQDSNGYEPIEGGTTMKELLVQLSDDLFKYLSFLERQNLIKSKDQAVCTSLEFYKMLSMHDWIPYVYRMGGGRILLFDSGSLRDLFHAMTDDEIYNAARMSAIKRKLTNPLFRDVDLTEKGNWNLILRELEIMGWGRFTRIRDEIRIELLAVPLSYILGYLETMFGTKFRHHRMRLADVTILVTEREKKVDAEP